MVNRSESHGNRGFALVVVVLVLLLVTALAAEMVFTVRTGIEEARQAKQNMISRGLAMAGINLALFHLVDHPVDLAEEEPYILGTTSSVYLDTGKVDFRMTSESGKIDLNKGSKGLLRLFLEQQGYDLDEQEILVDSMQDWKDKDDLHRLNGAESEYYETLTPPYLPENSSFVEPSEIFLVRGSEKLRDRINPLDFFTIYNRGGRINFNMLSPGMLYVLLDGDEERVQQYYDLQDDGVLHGAAQAQLILDDNYAMWQPYLVYSKGQNKYYTIVATGFAGAREPDENDSNVDPEKKYSGWRIRLLLSRTGKAFRYIRWSEESIVE